MSAEDLEIEQRLRQETQNVSAIYMECRAQSMRTPQAIDECLDVLVRELGVPRFSSRDAVQQACTMLGISVQHGSTAFTSVNVLDEPKVLELARQCCRCIGSRDVDEPVAIAEVARRLASFRDEYLSGDRLRATTWKAGRELQSIVEAPALSRQH